MATPNPFGLHTITPYLIVQRVPELIEFLTELFGANQRGELHMRDDGSVKHAEVQIGDSVVMMGEPMTEFKAQPATLYTYVDDCDATYAKALEIGAESVLEPEDYPHGDRYGGIKDLAGNTWWVVTHVGG
ncbi:VOC family protein [Adhaeretor mobilis]|uniref:Glyoxalase-like domain protein n=1 Tax=Adhaeretor mobilis TaxID=1930276 RepID=A0A517N080_9BACT|nr:VOC family protein [Adhaeretor mobilis]QDT00536.1 Glyoxalase-like domain protein [Adhaeretor mobilis]